MSMSDWPVAEQATIAAAIRDPGFRARVLEAGEEVFVHAEGRRVWRVLNELTQSGQIVDAAALEIALGHPVSAKPSTDYLPVLLDQRLRQQLELLGRWLVKPRRGVSPKVIAARAMQSLNQALTSTQQGTVLSGADAAHDGLQRLSAGDPRWLRSGVPIWDAAAATWGPDDLVLVGARPSQGKTALGVQWAWQTAKAGRGVSFCSVEMGPEAIGLRAVSQITEWPLAKIKVHLNDPVIVTALQDLMQWPWRVVDANGASVADLQAAVARGDVAGPRSDVVIVDYLQLLRPSAKVSNREQEIARIVAELKAWARRDRRLIVVLTQLNRAVEQRADHIPTLADLRESGSQEQDADAVVLIHRTQSEASDLIVAKNRNGPTGRIPVRWHGPTMQFYPRGI